jgi:hypothetical protein
MKNLLLTLAMLCSSAACAATRIEVILQVGDKQEREEFVLQVGESVQLGEDPLLVQGTVIAEEADKVVGEIVVFLRNEQGAMQLVGKDIVEAAWDTPFVIEFPLNGQMVTLTLIAHRA